MGRGINTYIKKLFTYGCTGPLLLCRLSLVAASRGYSSLCCTSLSLRWLVLLQSTGFSTCIAWAQLPHGMQNPPRSGIEPVSPALASGFLTTGLPGKSSTCIFIEGIHFVVVVQLLSHVQLFATSRTEACQASLSFTVSQNLLKRMSLESVMSSNHLILCCLLLLLPAIFPRFSLLQ